jgi:hypothetical protein
MRATTLQWIAEQILHMDQGRRPGDVKLTAMDSKGNTRPTVLRCQQNVADDCTDECSAHYYGYYGVR